MDAIQIPVTLSPHIVDNKPRGYYILGQRLFPRGAPELRKDQFVGFNGSLIISIARHNTWNSILAMGLYASRLHNRNITWLGEAMVYPMSKGFRIYVPGTTLKPSSAGKKIETIGVFRMHEFCGVEPLFYLEIPKINADILLGKEQL